MMPAHPSKAERSTGPKTVPRINVVHSTALPKIKYNPSGTIQKPCVGPMGTAASRMTKQSDSEIIIRADIRRCRSKRQLPHQKWLASRKRSRCVQRASSGPADSSLSASNGTESIATLSASKNNGGAESESPKGLRSLSLQ